MTQTLPQKSNLSIRPVQYRDLDTVDRLRMEAFEADGLNYSTAPENWKQPLHPWNGLVHAVRMLLNPFQKSSHTYLAEQGDRIQAVIWVSPFNRTHSTWRVDRVVLNPQIAAEAEGPTPNPMPTAAETSPAAAPSASPPLTPANVGSQLLRYCLNTILEARTWLLEVNVNDKDLLALYRQNGFQPLAQNTYWELSSETLQELADREPDVPNLLPVSNADAQLLYQLDTAAMPPLVRQVFDRHISDFKTSLFRSLMDGIKHWLHHTEVVSGYVFEPQRKAAIGYFQLRLCRNGTQAHQAQLTVHPAYTWLYPELMTQMARIAQDVPDQVLHITSADYHPEREEYLERIGADRIAHTLMMSRSVWHKVREAKPALEGLHLSEMLQGLQPARKPVPGRMSLLRSVSKAPKKVAQSRSQAQDVEPSTNGSRPNHLLNLPSQNDISDLPPHGPCC